MRTEATTQHLPAKRLTICSLQEFEDKTGLSLVIFVDTASDQLWRFFEHAPDASAITGWHKSEELFDVMSDRLCRVYSRNADFRRTCHGLRSREHMVAFVQHWVGSDFAKRFPRLRGMVPSDFYIGRPLPELARAIFN